MNDMSSTGSDPDGTTPPRDGTHRHAEQRPPAPPYDAAGLPPAAPGVQPAWSGQPNPYGPPGPPVPAPPAPYGYGAPGPYPPQAFGPPPGWSHRSKVAAGLLQLLPGFFLALGGIGRCYTGHIALGVTQLVVSVVGLATAPFAIGIPVVIGCWVWAVVDGIVLLSGQSRDADGLLLH